MKNGLIKYDVSNITNIFRNEKVSPISMKTTKYIDNPNKGKMLQPHYLEDTLEIDFFHQTFNY